VSTHTAWPLTGELRSRDGVEHDFEMLKRRTDRRAVVAAYEAMLGRAPESEEVIESFRGLGIEEILRAIAGSPEFVAQRHRSPFFYYNSAFDAHAVIQRHARDDLSPHPLYITNFLGVRIDPKFVPGVLEGRAGEVEGPPIPANWHADIAEWAAALRAVDLARGSFTIAELGCGWGCWMNNTGVAARHAGLNVQLIGVEADEGHISFAKEACRINGFAADQVVLHHGIAAATAGTALFPRQDASGEEWGLEPVFDATTDEHARALESGRFLELPVIPLADVIGDRSRLDLLHLDIQGGEADLVESCRPLLDQRVSYLVIGTHSREIEGRLLAGLLGSCWRLEIERPAILALKADGWSTTVDGVQGWRNVDLLPDRS
jgi:FkbM family methyltransferase